MIIPRGRRAGLCHQSWPRPQHRRKSDHFFHSPGADSAHHRDQLYEGEHDGIIDQDVFDQVQLQLKQGAPKRRHASNTKDCHLLTGLLFDETGDRLTPTHVRNHGRRYRYYVSKRVVDNGRDPDDPYAGWRLRAYQLEQVVERQLMDILRDRSQLMERFDNNLDADEVNQLDAAAEAKEKEWLVKTSEEKHIVLQSIFRRITIRSGWIRFELHKSKLLAWLIDKTSDTDENQITFVIERVLSLRRRGVESRLVLSNGTPLPNPDPALIDFIVRANRYLAVLTDGSSKTLTQIAVENNTNISEVSRLLPYAFLSPRLVESILCGSQPIELGVLRLSRIGQLPLNWDRQAKILGF